MGIVVKALKVSEMPSQQVGYPTCVSGDLSTLNINCTHPPVLDERWPSRAFTTLAC